MVTETSELLCITKRLRKTFVPNIFSIEMVLCHFQLATKTECSTKILLMKNHLFSKVNTLRNCATAKSAV